MKDFFNTMYIEPFTDRDWLGCIIGSLLWILTIGILVLVLWFFGWLIDSSYLPVKQKEGVVTSHYMIPAHSETTYMMVGKVMVPNTQYYDDEYKLTIKIDKLYDDVTICEDEWNEIKISDTLKCAYSTGRILNTLYIKSYSK